MVYKYKCTSTCKKPFTKKRIQRNFRINVSKILVLNKSFEKKEWGNLNTIHSRIGYLVVII